MRSDDASITATPSQALYCLRPAASSYIYTLSLHAALPISCPRRPTWSSTRSRWRARRVPGSRPRPTRSEEHTSELQSRLHLVCRLLLEKNNTVAHCLTSRSTTRVPFCLLHVLREQHHLSAR